MFSNGLVMIFNKNKQPSIFLIGISYKKNICLGMVTKYLTFYAVATAAFFSGNTYSLYR